MWNYVQKLHLKIENPCLLSSFFFFYLFPLISFFLFWYNFIIVYSIFIFFLALTIIRSILIAYDRACAYLWLTCFLFRSALLHTRMIGKFYNANVSICFIHTATELKEFLLSTENTSSTPITELYKEGRSSLIFSFTDMSHSWKRTFFPKRTTIFSPY